MRPRVGALLTADARRHPRPGAGLARLDYTQDAINNPLVAPYSPDRRPVRPYPSPIGWNELDDPELSPDRWTIRTVL